MAEPSSPSKPPAPRGVGHFRTAAGRDEYMAHYAQAMKQLPAPSATHDVPTSYGTVRVYEWQNKTTADTTPVALMPGRSSGVPMWTENLPGFARTHRVLAFDALGDAGASVQTAPLASMSDQAAWIDEVVARLSPAGVHLVGHSFGGATATAYALAHPERVTSLALLEPVFTFAYPPPAVFWWATVASLPGMPRSVREHALEKIGGADAGEADAESDPIVGMIAAASEHYSAKLPTPSPLSREQAGRLPMPVYVAIGGRDSLAGKKAADNARAMLQRGEVQVWPNATHSLPMQEKAALLTVLNGVWSSAEEQSPGR